MHAPRNVSTHWKTWVAIALIGCLYIATVGFNLGNTQKLAGNVAQGLAAFFAAGFCLHKSRAKSRPLRSTWLLLGLWAGFWGLGQVTWTIREMSNSPTLNTLWADAGFALSMPFGIAAILTFIDTPSGKIAWARAVLEGSMIGASLLFIAWALSLGELYRHNDGSLFDIGALLIYPVNDAITCALVLFAAGRCRREARPTLLIVGGAMLCFATADSAFTVLQINDTYSTGAIWDLGWIAAFLLVGFAAAKAPCEIPTSITHDADTRIQRFAAVITYIPFLAAGILVLVNAISLETRPVLRAIGAASLLLTGLTQLIKMLDNTRTTAFLESRVQERTQNLESQRRFFCSVVQHASDVVAVIDRDFRIIYQTQSSERVLGRDEHDTAGKVILDYFDTDERMKLEQSIRKSIDSNSPEQRCEVKVAKEIDCERILEVVVANLLNDDDVNGIVLTFSDRSAQKLLENELTKQAFHDSLTDLPNRLLFHERLTHAFDRNDRKFGISLGVLYMDLDDFKSVNDSLGHATGDALLKEFAERVQHALRPGDTFSRLGGDEFAVLIEDVHEIEEVLAVVERIQERLLPPFLVGGRELVVDSSIGVATDEHAGNADDIQRNADVAMYNAKARGQGRYQVYEPRMHDEAVHALEVESGLRRALENNEFVLHYQPLFDINTGEICGAEALLRWHDDVSGVAEPSQFIPIAEKTGLIHPIGRWVLRQACTDAANWYQRLGEKAPCINVNLSYRQLQNPDIIKELSEILFDTQLPPSRLTLELTESIWADDATQAANTLNVMKDLGVQLAIDDFGTGYSSLSYLRQFPFDELKIDRRFIGTLTDTSTGSNDPSLVQAIIDLGRLFNLKTVAEGVENEEQVEILRTLGCELAQGYFFAVPSSAEQFEELLGARQPS